MALSTTKKCEPIKDFLPLFATNLSDIEIEPSPIKNNVVPEIVNKTFLTDFSLDFLDSAQKSIKKAKNTENIQSFIQNSATAGGSFFRYTIQKANKIQRNLFGVPNIITPIRSSKRLEEKTKKMQGISLEFVRNKQKDLIYIPNELENVYEPLDEDSVIIQAYLNKNAK